MGVVLVVLCVIGFFALIFFSPEHQEREKERRQAKQLALFEAALMATTGLATERPARPISHEYGSLLAPHSASLVRQAEIIFESLRIAARSANPSTIASRIELARSSWAEAGFPLQGLVSADTSHALADAFERFVVEAHTGSVVTRVRKEVEKSRKLVTDKGRQRCIERAQAILQEAIGSPFVNFELVKSALADLVEITLVGDPAEAQA